MSVRTSQRLLIYDAVPWRGERLLRKAWATGAPLYQRLGYVDAAFGAQDWVSALDWLVSRAGMGSIAEVQFWGHGKWGKAFVGSDVLDRASLGSEHALGDRLRAVRGALLPNAGSLFWFRTCETFGAEAGQTFACDLADTLGCRVAGHTFVIGVWQSGLHGLYPGAMPTWSSAEGLRAGTPAEPREAYGSWWWRPHTLHFMNSATPEAWFCR
jgi:hypothetical protein